MKARVWWPVSWLAWKVRSSRKTGRTPDVGTREELALFSRLGDDALTVVRRRQGPDGTELLTVELPVVRLDDLLGEGLATALMRGTSTQGDET